MNEFPKTVIITGSNSGIGYYCAYYMAKEMNWHIILACRDEERGTKAVRQLIKQTSWPEIKFMRLDLASLESIRNFVDNYHKSALPPLRGLVNNAGVQIITGTTFTRDGFEMTFGVNHLGHFLLTNLLLPMMSLPSRIIVVSSEAHNPETSIGLPAPDYTDPYTLAKPDRGNLTNKSKRAHEGKVRYATSKLCNLLFAYELNRRLAAKGYQEPDNMISVHAYAPGIVPGTGIGKDYNWIARFGWRFLLPLVSFWPGIYTMKQAGKNLSRLVLNPDLSSKSGLYFEGRKIKKSSPESYDLKKAKELWDASADMVNLKDYQLKGLT
ncbi:MAG: SDR family NAD(P)-dependent oxidoreductase [Spirochaetales bacterium]|nr:SDR family NAD(P)-dependent oxidoreductase [Spirochaetales bacterium]